MTIQTIQIGVLGEALIDCINQGDNRYLACLGGSPFNFALALAKQQCPTTFLSPLSEDGFGQQFAKKLDSVGVKHPLSSSLPTSLAMVNIDKQGQASYRFYRQGVADRDYSVEAVLACLPEDIKILHTGGLALCPEDRQKLQTIFSVLRERDILISIDVNARPQAQRNHQEYYATIRHLMSYADIIKLSDEDIDCVFGDCDYSQRCEKLLADGATLVALTFGANGAQLVTKKNKIHSDTRFATQVADTIGAGDVFIASLIAWLSSHSSELSKLSIECLSSQNLLAAVNYACAAAAINVERIGCAPPSIDEISRRLQKKAVPS